MYRFPVREFLFIYLCKTKPNRNTCIWNGQVSCIGEFARVTSRDGLKASGPHLCERAGEFDCALCHSDVLIRVLSCHSTLWRSNKKLWTNVHYNHYIRHYIGNYFMIGQLFKLITMKLNMKTADNFDWFDDSHMVTVQCLLSPVVISIPSDNSSYDGQKSAGIKLEFL